MTKNLSIIGAVILLAVAGCSQPQYPSVNAKDAQDTFSKILKEESQIDATLFPFKHSLWIYVPLKEDFFTYKAKGFGVQKSKQSVENINLNYIDVSFADKNFVVDYDISASYAYPADPGFATAYGEKFSQVQQGVMGGVYRAFASVDDGFDFYILVLANIKQGLEMKIIFNHDDIMRAHSDQAFIEENQKRQVIEPISGNLNIVGDDKGKYLKPYDLMWTEFLSKQMMHRIRFKYQQSAFKPSEDSFKELSAQVKNTVNAYNFDGFNNVVFNNLLDGSQEKITRGELNRIKTQSTFSKGRIHTLKFNQFGEITEDKIEE